MRACAISRRSRETIIRLNKLTDDATGKDAVLDIFVALLKVTGCHVVTWTAI